MALQGNDSARMKGTPGTLSKGRRKLSFESKPLTGKSFYLNLKCSFKEIATLQTDIKQLGGTIESFLSKSVTYVVNDRSVAKETSTSSSPTQNPDWSPKTSPSPSSETPSYSSMTRGKLLLQKAVHSRRHGSTDILTNAKAWGVKIVTLDILKSWISDAKKPKVTLLKGAYIKVDDDESLYRPSFRQFVKKCWPSLSINKEKHRRHTRRHGVEREDVSKTAPGEEVQDDSKQEGYCECCQVYYDDLTTHVLKTSHQTFAQREDNYIAVDSINETMPDVNQFISEYTPCNNSDSMDCDEVLLISPFPKRRCVKDSPETKHDRTRLHVPDNNNEETVTQRDDSASKLNDTSTHREDKTSEYLQDDKKLSAVKNKDKGLSRRKTLKLCLESEYNEDSPPKKKTKRIVKKNKKAKDVKGVIDELSLTSPEIADTRRVEVHSRLNVEDERGTSMIDSQRGTIDAVSSMNHVDQLNGNTHFTNEETSHQSKHNEYSNFASGKTSEESKHNRFDTHVPHARTSTKTKQSESEELQNVNTERVPGMFPNLEDSVDELPNLIPIHQEINHELKTEEPANCELPTLIHIDQGYKWEGVHGKMGKEEEQNDEFGFNICVAEVMEKLQTWDAQDEDDFNTMTSCREWGNVFDAQLTNRCMQESQNTRTNLQNTPAHSQNTPAHSQNTHAHSQNTHTHSQNTHAHSQNTHAHSQNTHAHWQNTHTHSQNTHAHSQNTRAHSQNTHTHSQNTHAQSQNTHTHSQNTHAHSQNTHTHSQNTQRNSKNLKQQQKNKDSSNVIPTSSLINSSNSCDTFASNHVVEHPTQSCFSGTQNADSPVNSTAKRRKQVARNHVGKSTTRSCFSGSQNVDRSENNVAKQRNELPHPYYFGTQNINPENFTAGQTNNCSGTENTNVVNYTAEKRTQRPQTHFNGIQNGYSVNYNAEPRTQLNENISMDTTSQLWVETNYIHTPTQKSTSYNHTPTRQQTSYNHTPTRQQTSYNHTPTRQQTSYNHTPTHKPTSYNHTPTHKQTSYNHTPGQKQTSYNHTPTHKQTSYNHTPTQETIERSSYVTNGYEYSTSMGPTPYNTNHTPSQNPRERNSSVTSVYEYSTSMGPTPYNINHTPLQIPTERNSYLTNAHEYSSTGHTQYNTSHTPSQISTDQNFYVTNACDYPSQMGPSSYNTNHTPSQKPTERSSYVTNAHEYSSRGHTPYVTDHTPSQKQTERNSYVTNAYEYSSIGHTPYSTNHTPSQNHIERNSCMTDTNDYSPTGHTPYVNNYTPSQNHIEGNSYMTGTYEYSSSMEPTPCVNLLPVFVGLTERIKMNRRSCRKNSEHMKADFTIQECSVVLNKDINRSKKKRKNNSRKKY